MTKKAEHGRTFMPTHTVGCILYTYAYGGYYTEHAHCSQPFSLQRSLWLDRCLYTISRVHFHPGFSEVSTLLTNGGSENLDVHRSVKNLHRATHLDSSSP